MITRTQKRQAKFLGGMIGGALGDAIGKVAFAGMDAANLCADLDLIDSLPYTDETVMAMGLAETLSVQGRLDEQQLGNCLRRHYQREPWRGFKHGPATVFALVEEQGLSYRQAAAQLGHHAGALDSDAATRITPVGLFFADAPNLYEQAALSAAVTHVHPVAIDGTAVLAKAIAQVVPWTPAIPFSWQPWLRALITFAQTRVLREQLQITEDLFRGQVAPKVAFDYLGRGSTVQTTLPFALYAFLCHPTSFAHCVLCAVTHGGERNALGAMAGAIAGAYLGLEAIPLDWRAKLENRCYLERLAHILAEMASFPNNEPSYFSTRWPGKWN